MAKANELKRGQAVNLQGQVHMVVETEHVAKGNKRSYYQIKLRNLNTGQLVQQRFRVDDEVARAFLQRKETEYLYSHGNGHVLMDLESYDQITVDDQIMGNGTEYVKPNTPVGVVIHDGRIVAVELPHTVELKVKDTPPILKGATATNQSKDATLETGLRVKVPPFIEVGEMIRVDTRTGEYIERARPD